ncbi:MAG: GTPase Era [Alphaproteobacteria bacterium]
MSPKLDHASPATRCGLIALVGAPNVGKSTLINALVGERVGIVSSKPNTTRIVVRGVVTEGATQFVFVDTPGLNTSAKAFDRALVQQAQGSLAEADVVALVIDAGRGFDDRAMDIVARIQQGKRTAVLIINKVDRLVPRERVLPLMTRAAELGCFAEVLAVAAANVNKKGGGGMKDVLPRLAKYVPEGPWLFPADMATDMPLYQRLAEITREQVMTYMHEEVPYAIAVVTDSVDDSGMPWLVQQRILLTREAHKPLVIGKGGSMLGRMGTAAREVMQDVLGTGVRLELHVEVSPDWQERAHLLYPAGDE